MNLSTATSLLDQTLSIIEQIK